MPVNLIKPLRWMASSHKDYKSLPAVVQEQFGFELFLESFRYSEDWDLVLRLAAATEPRRIPGVTVEVRMRESGNASSELNPERLACLERLSQRHGLGKLPAMTFWEVAAIAAGSA